MSTRLSRFTVRIVLLLSLFSAETIVYASTQPDGISLYLAFRNGSRQFRQGEVIPLRLSFTSSIPGRYHIDTATYDRSGRMNSERFDLEPHDGWSDPLVEYFNSGLFSFMGGGIRSIPELGSEPQVIDLDLNEWVRFDRPGHYRVSVHSSRIIQGRGEQGGGTHCDVQSNEIEFDVLASDDQWAQQKFNEAIGLLSSQNRGDALQGARILRFLGTNSAVRAMVDRFRGDGDGFDDEYIFGLLGANDRRFAVQETEQAIHRSDHPISPSFLHTLAVLAYRLDNPEPLPAPPPFSMEADDSSQKLWREQSKRREDALRPYGRRYLAMLMDSLETRRDRSFAEALVSIMVDGSEIGALDDPAFATFFTRLRTELPAVFLQLPKGTQDSLLDFWWDQIRSPEMLPVLRKLYDATPNFTRGQYLELMESVDPQEARKLVLEDMQREHPTLLYDQIHVLGNEPMPKLDHVLADRLDEFRRDDGGSLRTFALLVERHSTAAMATQIERTYERLGDAVDCTAKAFLLAYFLRVDLPYAKTALEKTSPVIGNPFRGCETAALAIALDHNPSRDIEAFAVSRLWNLNPAVSISSAEALREHGSKDAEKALWKRLGDWHEIWARLSEQGDSQQQNAQLQIGTALLDAIAKGNSWLSDDEKLARLQDFCVSKEQCSRIDNFRKRWKNGPELTIIVFNHQEVWPHIAQYEFGALNQLWPKLAQLPSGTRLRHKAEYQPQDKAHAEHILSELAKFAEEHGLELERAAE